MLLLLSVLMMCIGIVILMILPDEVVTAYPVLNLALLVAGIGIGLALSQMKEK